MLSGISNFEWNWVENLVNYQQFPFTGTEWHSNFGCNLCKNCWEKHLKAFVKVVDGSEIYNFPSHHLVHFYSNFWRFSHSNQGTVKQFRVSRAPRRDVACRRRPPSASAPSCLPRPAHPPRPCAFPRTPAPRDALKSAPRHVPAGRPRRTTAGRAPRHPVVHPRFPSPVRRTTSASSPSSLHHNHVSAPI
jgi:hypothetical protein